MIRIALTIAALAAALTAPLTVNAQTRPACDGQSVTLRVSRLTPNGTLAGLADAVKAQRAWYVSHGYKSDSVVMATMLDGSRASTREFVTIHTRTGAAPELKRDAAWEAFVATYKANSTIGSETRFCLPKGAKLSG